MVATLLTQAVFVVLLLLCPWKELADFMELEFFSMDNADQYIFRIYLLIIPVLHLVLAIGIEVRIVNIFRLKSRKMLPP